MKHTKIEINRNRHRNRNCLDMAAVLELLRRYQRLAQAPSFTDFIGEVHELCTVPGQEGPLNQRLALLQSLVAESAANESLRNEGAGIVDCCKPGSLVVVDLTDPLLARDEANGIFQVLTEQYRSRPMKCGKLLALDEVRPSVRQSSQSVKHIKSIRQIEALSFLVLSLNVLISICDCFNDTHRLIYAHERPPARPRPIIYNRRTSSWTERRRTG